MLHTKIIKPRRGLIGINLKEIIHFRELLYFLAWRDIKVRYKQTLVGAVWAILQPILTMVVFSIFFGKIAKIPSDGIPYPIFSYAGLLLWTFFANSMTAAAGSVIADERLISKVYFPRIIIPTSATLWGLLDYGIASVILFGMMIYYKIAPSWYILLIPVILFFTWLLANGLGYLLSAINVKYRDVRYAVPFFTQLLIYITPVIYPLSIASGKYKWLLSLNPMSGFIESHRAVILGHQAINFSTLGLAIIITIFIFIIGIAYFKSVERFFADFI